MNIQIIKYFDLEADEDYYSGQPVSQWEKVIADLQTENKNLLKTNEILNKENKDYSDQIDELKAQIQMLVTNNRKK